MSEITTAPLKHKTVREAFPILDQEVHGKPLVYLDSAATTQKPKVVIDVISEYYAQDNANVHRGVYELCQRATGAYEGARQTVRNFINAKRNHEIIFTKSATEAINLVASSFGEAFIREGDEIIISEMEHHSNIVPWQLLCERTGAILKVISVKDDGVLDLTHYQQLLTASTKLVAVTQVSNVLGTINPVKEIIDIAHKHKVPVLLDGAQAIPHMTVDVQELDCDFYVFSSHKVYGPTGVGVLYGKTELLEVMPPYQGGGDMISRVTFKKTEYNILPYKFEAGTPNMAGVIGLGAAIDYLNHLGMHNIFKYEESLFSYAMRELQAIPGLRFIGAAAERVGSISFVMDCAHPHDIGTVLDHEGVAVRVGHHCAMPLMERFDLPATVRVSFGLYNRKADVDSLVVGLYKVIKLFAH